MITQLHLQGFKSFADATLDLGPFTLLVGANASGKSNLRDAFRFLHGIGRGYTLPEIIGEKRTDGGEKVWRGIRGGTRNITYQTNGTFTLDVTLTIPSYDLDHHATSRTAHYHLAVVVGQENAVPIVQEEILRVAPYGEIYHANPIYTGFNQQFSPSSSLLAWYMHDKKKTASFYSNTPALSQWSTTHDPTTHQLANQCMDVLKSIRFLEPHPDAMRQPSVPGQTILSDHGENLASVLHTIVNATDPQRKHDFLSWLQVLTPMDVTDLAFESDPTGRIVLMLVEANGQRISAYSASDGTLRFLAMLAALLSPQPARFFFFEELESGIHPTRLHLLVDLIEQKTAAKNMQVVATTHSPQLLLMVNPTTLEHTSLTYRLPHTQDTRITRIMDLPNARHLIEKQDIASLYESGWLEDAADFMADTETKDDDEDGEDMP